MSADPGEYVLFSDPRRLVVDGRIAAQARKQELGEMFVRAVEPSAEARARDEQLDALADAVADRLVSRLSPGA